MEGADSGLLGATALQSRFPFIPHYLRSSPHHSRRQLYSHLVRLITLLGCVLSQSLLMRQRSPVLPLTTTAPNSCWLSCDIQTINWKPLQISHLNIKYRINLISSGWLLVHSLRTFFDVHPIVLWCKQQLGLKLCSEQLKDACVKRGFLALRVGLCEK